MSVTTTSEIDGTVRAKPQSSQAQSVRMKLPERTAETDRARFDRLVVEHHERIRRLVFRLLGWRDGSEDVVQEVFLSAWGAWGRFHGGEAAELWLRRIAVNKCRSRLRRQAVHERWFGWWRAVAPVEPQSTTDDPLVERERAEQVQAAIQSLAARYREVIVLHYLEELSIDEIAQLVGSRRNTIEVQLHRARRQLESVLADLK